MHVKEKSVVKMLLSGASVGHARTDVQVRDVTVTIDEPADRGGTNLGPTPTEALAASLLSCTNVIARRVAKKTGFAIHDLRLRLEMSFDRRGASLVEEVEVPFPDMRMLVSVTTDADTAQVEQLKADVRRFCPIACMLRASGTILEEEWEVHAA